MIDSDEARSYLNYEKNLLIIKYKHKISFYAVLSDAEES